MSAARDLLVIGPARMFYSGRLRRRLSPRCLGAVAIYASPAVPFAIGWPGMPMAERRICAVPAHVPHRIVPPEGILWNLCIEPEDTGGLETLLARFNAAEAEAMPALDRLRAGEAALRAGAGGDLSAAALDRLLLGRTLPRRKLDPRIAAVLEHLRGGEAEGAVPAAACAAAAGLSVSRFLHLFKAETGVPFRSCRMWQRARRFLRHTADGPSLTAIAMDLGYPDAAHFSRSISRTFGMQPSTLRRGARDLRVLPDALFAKSAS